MFAKVLALIVAALPLPVFTDPEAVKAWLGGLNASLGDLIAALVSQFQATGKVEIECPDGSVCSMAPDANGVWAMTDEDQAKLVSAAPEKFGDGKFAEIFKLVLPLILQLLPLFLKKEAEPTPEPIPNPTPVV